MVNEAGIFILPKGFRLENMVASGVGKVAPSAQPLEYTYF